jgi:hypothetical protein
MNFNTLQKIDKLIEEAEKNWSEEVEPKWKAPEGLFASGSASKIADEVSQHGKASLQKAMARINFYENRAGKNLSQERKATLEKVKNILHGKLKKETKD